MKKEKNFLHAVCLNCKLNFQVKRNATGKFCTLHCVQGFYYKKWIKNWLSGNIINITSTPPNQIRRYLFEKQKKSCCSCGLSLWEGLPIALQLDHLDGNHKNSEEKNLCLLCPNCHALTKTYGAKNKGHGRAIRNVYNKITLEKINEAVNFLKKNS